jgi:hypothetical protein
MSHTLKRGCRHDLALNVHAPTANRNDHSKDSSYEELEEMFDHFRTYHMQIMFGCCKAKFGREDKFKLIIGKDHIG